MIRTDGIWFKDEHGRTLMLRGVNLGGSSKVPFQPNGATHLRENFFDHRNVSFVGRPFPLEQADEHFARLRAWGFDFLRLLVTWEAIEHAGPGVYDEEYLDYIYTIAKIAGTMEFSFSLTHIKTCGADFPAAMVRRAGHSKQLDSTLQILPRPARQSSMPRTAIRFHA